MGDITTASGAKIFIGPVVTSATDTASEYAALTNYVEIGLAETLGEFGDESASVNFTALNDARVRKAKGSRNAGTLALTVGRDPIDPGQIALEAAQATNFKYAFKIVYPDRPNPTGTDSVEYFRALVMSNKRNIGNADNVIRRSYPLDIDSAITEVPATAGA